MHRYTATIDWQREGDDFRRGRYSRAHHWRFDGGIRVAASASPLVVPLPFSSAQAIDPEEALVVAAASCHMLSFLHVAARRGFVVERYEDEAEGLMEKIAGGRYAITRITLRPRILFAQDQQPPTGEELSALHHAAHEECYIANSIRAEVVVEATG